MGEGMVCGGKLSGDFGGLRGALSGGLWRGGGGGIGRRWWRARPGEAHLFSPPLLLANAAAVAITGRRGGSAPGAARLDFGGCAVEWEQEKWSYHRVPVCGQLTRPGVGDGLHTRHSSHLQSSRPAGRLGWCDCSSGHGIEFSFFEKFTAHPLEHLQLMILKCCQSFTSVTTFV
jgi:hypothetical protein